MKHFIMMLIAVLMSHTAFAQGWLQQNSPTANTLRAVVFVDSSRGWAVGNSGTILHTTDGGGLWAVQTSGTTASFYGLCFTNENDGWAVGDEGAIVHTTDGGGTWTPQVSGTMFQLNSVDFVDENHGWAVGGVGWWQSLIVHTTDGGETWSPQTSGITSTLSAVDFLDANNGWTVGGYFNVCAYGAVVHTTDGGLTWTVVSEPDVMFTDVEIMDANNGWAAGSSGCYWTSSWSELCHTTDGGITWPTSFSSESQFLQGVDFVDENHGWAVGGVGWGEGLILRTTDGGGTWSSQTLGTTNSVNGVAFVDENHGWAVGEGGAILHYGPPPCPSTTVPFMCHFDSLALDSGWFWIREDTSLWSLNAVPGWMRIYGNGDLTGGTNDAANILLRCVPNGDVRIETKLAYSPPFDHVMGAGLVVYSDDDNYANILREADFGQYIRSHSEQDGQTTYNQISQDSDPTYLRIEKRGSIYRTYASPDSLNWTLVGAWQREWTWDDMLWVGLLYTGSLEIPVPADFDYFRVDSLTTTSSPQPDTLWTRTYGGSNDDYAYSIQQTADGGYIVAGLTRSFGAGDWDFYLVKTDASGDTLWTRTYGGSNWDEAHSVQQTADGGYIVAGTTYSFGAGNSDFYLVKTNSQGDTLWTRTYGGSAGDWGDWAYSVQQTADGGYIVAGYTNSFGAGSYDFYLVKTSSLGDTLWTRTYGGSNSDGAWSVQQTGDGGYIVAGETWSFGAGDRDLYLVKTDALGDTLWTRTYGGSDDDAASSVDTTADGGYIVAGTTASFGAGDQDFYLVKTNSSGEPLWTRTYGGSGDDEAWSVQQIADEGYIVAGPSGSFGAGGGDFYLVKTNSSGDTLLTRTYGGSSYDEARSVQQTADGGYIVSGTTGSFGAGWFDFYLVKTEPELAAQPQANLSPKECVLHQNYPNPFNPSTTIAYDLPKAGHISLRVFDLLGREIAVLKDGMVEAGSHRVMFDGSGLASGIYFARLDARSFSQTKKLMLLK